ncbi:MAG: hypothetical protein WC850_01025 [Candidatus Gracilibacteria bacterium]
MNFLEFKSTFGKNILISKNEILLNFPNFDNKNLTYWQNKGYIKKLIKEYYIFSDLDIDINKLYYISNNIYFPSYISSFQALNYYGIIPEQVVYITAFSTNGTKIYSNDIGIFKYHNIKNSLFWGYDSINFGKFSFYIADIEKTILDFFYINKKYKTKEDIIELRLNYTILKEKLDKNKLLKYLKIFDNKMLEKTIFIFLDLLKND